ncbi:substrate-binding periplasmic protein [Shewanella sp. TC10]|uniref:substrate-binding periplasmic protein n=1 Tax=Shewanella sp. TC10 TaxID=1419739 RepID=UPI001892D0EE|nr:transporter substrate-binding domain-containing protein [Shewanella sp. TC10]
MSKIILTLPMIFLSQQIAAEEYHFVGVEGSSIQNIGKLVFQQLCAEQQLNCDVEMLPAPRAERSMLASKAVGEVMRVWSYGEEHPNFIRVPTSYYSVKTAVYVRKGSGINVQTAADLKGLTIGVLEGVKHSQNVSHEAKSVIKASTPQQLVNLLTRERVDAIVSSYVDGKATIAAMNADKLVELSTITDTHPLYIYIHPDHAQLAPIIDNTINKLMASGEMSSIILEAESHSF